MRLTDKKGRIYSSQEIVAAVSEVLTPVPEEYIYRPVPKERAIKIGEKPVAVVFAHGAYQSEEDLSTVRELLESEGVPTLAPRLPIEFAFKPKAKKDKATGYHDAEGRPLTIMGLDDLANKLVLEMRIHEIRRAIMVGLSLGGDPIARAAAMARDIDVVHMDLFDCPLHKATVASLYPRRARNLWRLGEKDGSPTAVRNNAAYLNGIDGLRYRNLNLALGVSDGFFGLTTFNKSVAPQVFFNRSPASVAEQSTERLRPTFRNRWETMLKRWRQVPTDAYRGLDNYVTGEAWCRDRASLIGASFTELDCDHSPHRSIPEEMTDILLDQVTRYY